MINQIKTFMQDEEGQSMVEYGVTLGAVAAVSYIAVVQLGDKTADLYAWMANHLPGGESNEIGTSNLVRISEGGRHGLVALSATSNGLVFDADHILEEGYMAHSLSSPSTLVNVND